MALEARNTRRSPFQSGSPPLCNCTEPAGATIKGSVRGGCCAGRSAEVTIFDSQGNEVASTQVGAGGTYSVKVDPGTYGVMVWNDCNASGKLDNGDAFGFHDADVDGLMGAGFLLPDGGDLFPLGSGDTYVADTDLWCLCMTVCGAVQGMSKDLPPPAVFLHDAANLKIVLAGTVTSDGNFCAVLPDTSAGKDVVVAAVQFDSQGNVARLGTVQVTSVKCGKVVDVGVIVIQ